MIATTIIAIPEDNNLFSNHQRDCHRSQNFNDYQSRDQNNGYNDGSDRSANHNSGQGEQSSNRNNNFQDGRHRSQRGENRDSSRNSDNYPPNSGNHSFGESNQNPNQSNSNDQRRDENNQPPRDSHRDDDHQLDDQQGNTGQESQNDPRQEENSIHQSFSDDITCLEPLNTSAASSDPTPEVVNSSQPDQQNRVGGSFNTVRYERADAVALYPIICTCTSCTYTYILYIPYMAYRTPGYTLPYIPIRILYHTKLQTLFTISCHHCNLAC